MAELRLGVWGQEDSIAMIFVHNHKSNGGWGMLLMGGGHIYATVFHSLCADA